MKYHIEEKEENIKHLYNSICPLKVRNKDGQVLYRHVRQSIYRKTITLFIDDIDLYKKEGGKTGEQSYKTNLPETWRGISGLYYIEHSLPQDNSSCPRKNGHQNSYFIISQQTKDDTLRITTEDVIYVDSIDGLFPITTAYKDYYKSWYIDVPFNEGETRYNDIIREFRQLHSKNNDWLKMQDSLKSTLNLSANDSGIVQLAKISDYVILKEIVDKEGAEDSVIPYKDIIYKRKGLYWTHGYLLYSGISKLDLNPSKWIFNADHYNKARQEMLVREAEELADATDKGYAKKALQKLLSQWTELGVDTHSDRTLWERLIKIIDIFKGC